MVRCTAPWEGFHVLYGGDVKCCTWSNVVVGNVHEKSITEIWNGPGFAEVRERMHEDDIARICPSWCPRLYEDSSKPRLEVGKSEIFSQNVMAIQAEIEEGATRLTSMPVDFRIVPTNACNLRCIMCGKTDVQWVASGRTSSRILLHSTLTLGQFWLSEASLSSHAPSSP